MTQLSLFVLLVTPFLAQDAPKADETGAESLYRDAWWQETGAGALDRALAGYLKAADADGTEEIRAKALYRAALIQQRIGKTDEAIQTLGRLAKDFPGERAILAEAQKRLAEWTAVDLRRSFNEWYERYLYSPEFQAKIVDLVLKLGSTPLGSVPAPVGIESELLTIGKPSLPALRHALASSNPALRKRVVALLMRLGEYPDAEVMVANDWEWTRKHRGWELLADAPAETRDRLKRELKGSSPLRDAMRAVLTSRQAMVAFLQTDAANLHGNSLLRLLVYSPDDKTFDTLSMLSWSGKVPEDLRTTAFHRLLDRYPDRIDPADLIRAFDDPRKGSRLRPPIAAVLARQLEAGRTDTLDAMLEAGLEPGDGPQVGQAFRRIQRLGKLPWTEERVARFHKAPKTGHNVGALALEKNGAEALAAYFVAEVKSNPKTALAGRLPQGNWPVAGVAKGVKWGDVLGDAIALAWHGWNDTTRQAAVAGTYSVFSSYLPAKVKQLFEQALRQHASPQLKARIVNVLGDKSPERVLEVFDLEDPTEAEIASRFLRNYQASPELLRSFLPLMEHPKPEVRGAFVQHFHADGRYAPALAPFLETEPPGHQSLILTCLGRGGTFETLPYLVATLKSPAGHIRQRAAAMLGGLASPKAVPGLVALLDDPDPKVRTAALEALNKIQEIQETKERWNRKIVVDAKGLREK